MRVGHYKSDTGEEFAHMPLDPTDNPSGFTLFFSRVRKLDTCCDLIDSLAQKLEQGVVEQKRGWRITQE